MVGKETGTSEVIHFSCGQCQTSLTVDHSLAGVTGPCPSCGQSVTAPAAVSVSAPPQSIEIKPREVTRRARVDDEAPVSEQRSQGRSSSRKGGRAVSPNTGLSESHQEKLEIAAIVKMLIAGLLVLGIVLVVAYLLNSQFQSP